MRLKIIGLFTLVFVGLAVFYNYYLGGDRYLNRYAENQILLVIAPPHAGGKEALRDKETFLQTRLYQDSPRWQKAIQDADLTTDNFFSEFDCATQRQLTKLEGSDFQFFFHKTIVEVNRLTRKSKNAFMQERPFKLYQGAICTPISGYDYPSGHAMIGWMTARILAEIYPERQEQLFDRARSFAESRVICGFHSVSAVEVAEYYSQQIMKRLKEVPSFQRDLALAKKQMQALPKLAGKIKSCDQFPAQFVKPFSHAS